MDGVVPTADGDGAAADVDVARGIVLVVLRVEAVGAGGELQDAVRDADGVVGLQGLFVGGDHVGAAGDLQIVLAHHAVFAGGDGQGAGAVEGQVALGEDHAVQIGVTVLDEAAGDGEGAVYGGGDEHFVGGLHVDGGGVVVGEVEPLQHQLHLILLVRLHGHGHVPGAAGQHVGPGGGDGDVLAVGHGVGHGLGKVRYLQQIPVGEQVAPLEDGRSGGNGDDRGPGADGAGLDRGGGLGRGAGLLGLRLGEGRRPRTQYHANGHGHDGYP